MREGETPLLLKESITRRSGVGGLAAGEGEEVQEEQEGGSAH